MLSMWLLVQSISLWTLGKHINHIDSAKIVHMYNSQNLLWQLNLCPRNGQKEIKKRNEHGMCLSHVQNAQRRELHITFDACSSHQGQHFLLRAGHLVLKDCAFALHHVIYICHQSCRIELDSSSNNKLSYLRACDTMCVELKAWRVSKIIFPLKFYMLRRTCT